MNNEKLWVAIPKPNLIQEFLLLFIPKRKVKIYSGTVIYKQLFGRLYNLEFKKKVEKKFNSKP